MKLKHTPGPWEIKETDKYTILVKAPWSEKIKPSKSDGYGSYLGIHITELKHQNDNPCVSKKTAIANARLISCAPEMLESLISEYKEMCNVCNLRHGDVCEQDGCPNNTLIKSIIEKATDLTIEEVLNAQQTLHFRCCI